MLSNYLDPFITLHGARKVVKLRGQVAELAAENARLLAAENARLKEQHARARAERDARAARACGRERGRLIVTNCGTSIRVSAACANN